MLCPDRQTPIYSVTLNWLLLKRVQGDGSMWFPTVRHIVGRGGEGRGGEGRGGGRGGREGGREGDMREGREGGEG